MLVLWKCASKWNRMYSILNRHLRMIFCQANAILHGISNEIEIWTTLIYCRRVIVFNSDLMSFRAISWIHTSSHFRCGFFLNQWRMQLEEWLIFQRTDHFFFHDRFLTIYFSHVFESILSEREKKMTDVWWRKWRSNNDRSKSVGTSIVALL